MTELTQEEMDQRLTPLLDGIENVLQGANMTSALAAIGIIQHGLLADALDIDRPDSHSAILTYIEVVRNTMNQIETLATSTDGQTIN